MDSTQITIRGLDPTTKKLLAKKATSKGLSMNAFALDVLRVSVGNNSSAERLRALQEFLSRKRHLNADDVSAIDDNLKALDNLSSKKQQTDDTDN